MIEESSFFLGDVVYVKDSHPFVGVTGLYGIIDSFLTDVMALVKFEQSIYALDDGNLELFKGTIWCIPLMHLERIKGDDSSGMSLLLENQELKVQLEAHKGALELSEALREQQAKQLKGV